MIFQSPWASSSEPVCALFSGTNPRPRCFRRNLRLNYYLLWAIEVRLETSRLSYANTPKNTKFPFEFLVLQKKHTRIHIDNFRENHIACRG